MSGTHLLAFGAGPPRPCCVGYIESQLSFGEKHKIVLEGALAGPPAAVRDRSSNGQLGAASQYLSTFGAGIVFERE